ncbi:MAG TPA: RodZ domain-containing protein [Acidimicrobiales bacterium]|nr:RodZ domain-containing protein [Acidimicrobiales bacterium]
MWIAVIAVVLVALGAVVAKLTWRPNPDEAHSVRRYRTALGTMEHISDRAVRSTEGSSGPVESSESAAGWEGTPSVHITGRETTHRAPEPVPVPERAVDEIRGPDGELVFDDARPADRARRPGFRPIAPEFRSERARKQAFHAMEHRQWHWRTPAVVIVVLVVFGVLAFVGSRRSNNHPTSRTSNTTVAGHQTIPAHQGSPAVPTTTKPPHPTTTTTTKPPTQLIATSTSAGAATYSVGASTYNIVLTASGLCWVDAVDASSGNAIFSGTVQPGATQVIHATGATNVTMGASFTSLTANNIPVVLPTPFQVPFTATFQPPATGATTTTTTTPTTTP